MITVVSNISSYTPDKGFLGWAEITHLMQSKTKGDFMPATVGRRAYGIVIAGVLHGYRKEA